jgi:TRAP-type mannitol/chloroaromatic compound transport system permease large subunit
MLDQGWEFTAPAYAVWVSYMLWALTLEAVRRCGGLTLFTLVLLFSLYPTVADKLPGVISGMSSSPAETAAYHVISIESILGLPFRAFAELVIGFLVFGIALQHTGGGKFFINLAFSMFGHVRGGSAKVAIVSSGLMGSMSGSVITNVLTTGQMTIPAMKRDGLDKEYAAGVEACASTGGVLLPPIMGSTAFVMATFLNVPYTTVALAATIPALLYFFGLFVQVDAYAARNGLKGTPREELPKLSETMKEGWYYLAAFLLLIFLLVYMQREAIAPYYATGLLLILTQMSRSSRWDWSKTVSFMVATGKLLAELLAIMAGVGLIVGALSITGLSGTLVNDVLRRRLHLAAVIDGCADEFCAGYRHDSDRRLYISGNHSGARTYPGRTQSHECASVYSVLGYVEFHYTACRAGSFCCCEYRWSITAGYRFQSHAPGQCHLLHSILLRLEPGTDPGGQLAGNPARYDYCECGRVSGGRRLAGLSARSGVSGPNRVHRHGGAQLVVSGRRTGCSAGPGGDWHCADGCTIADCGKSCRICWLFLIAKFCPITPSGVMGLRHF